MKTLNLLKLGFYLLLVTNFVSCSASNDAKIVQLPELINKDTGLRELRMRRYDCLHLVENKGTSSCTENEVIVVEKDPKVTSIDSLNTQNLRVNELTPWLKPQARTMVNPTVMYNEAKGVVYVTSYLRFLDKTQNKEIDHKYEFKGDLNALRKKYRTTGKTEYLNLVKASSESDEVVNAVIYCGDMPKCKDITLVFSFLNYNLSGQRFIDSRPFQIDQRETNIKSTDVVPQKSVRSVTHPIYDIEISETEKSEYDKIHVDDALTSNPLGPVLPTENIDQLCKGLTRGEESCPKYLLDSSLPKPKSDELIIDNNIDKNNIQLDPTQEVLFPNEEDVFSAIDLGVVNSDQILIDETESEDLAPEVDHEVATKDVVIEDSYESNKKVWSEDIKLDDLTEMTDQNKDEEKESTSSQIRMLRPKRRPVRTTPKTQPEPKINSNDESLKSTEDSSDVFKSKKDQEIHNAWKGYVAETTATPKEAVGLQKSLRPRLRPEGLADRFKELGPDAKPFASIDGKFTYDLSKCGEHIIKTKNLKYAQARGVYWQGSLKNGTYFGQSDYETNYPSPANSSSQYSSTMTREMIEFAGCVLEQRYGDRVEVYIKSFSSKNGGQLGGHGSHQNGLDVDVSYPHLDGKTKQFDNFASNITEARLIAAFDYARLLIYTERAHILFTDNRLRKGFCSYLKANDKLSSHRDVVEKFMRHISGHHNHFHVRAKCNSQNVGCVAQANFGSDNICK